MPVTKTSEELIRDLYKMKAHRLHLDLMFSMAICVVLLGFIIWVKYDTNRLVNSIKQQNLVSAERSAKRDEQLNQLGNTIVKIGQENQRLTLCLLALHDPANFGGLVSEEDCHKQVESVSTLQPTEQTSESQTAEPSQSTPQPTNQPQSQTPAPAQMNPIQSLENLVSGTIKDVRNLL